MSKPRVIKDYEKLPEEVVEQIKLVYPYGFVKYLISFTNREGQLKKALPFETEEYYYLIRMNEQVARDIIENDEDYDDDGNLKQDVLDDYDEKYGDDTILNELNANDDNNLGE